MAKMVKSPPAVQETRVSYLGWEDLLKKEMAVILASNYWQVITPVILASRIPLTEEPGGL